MNKNISQLGQQLVAIWGQLGLNQRISIVLATVMLAVGLGGIAFWSSRADYALLYGKLDEGEASKVIAALDEAKIPYKVRGAGTIMVPSDKVYQVRMQMAGKGIPQGEGVGFEIFDKANFGISDFVQHANYTRAVQGELARTISQLDQVESARVMIVMPENRLISDGQRRPTASVFVKVKGNAQLGSSSVNSIRFLVANSVEGLQANNVSVVDNLGNVLSENQENDSVAGLSANQLTARRNFEQYLSKKAEGMLDAVLGPGQAVVRVSADLNWDTITKTEEKFDPDGQVARTTTINDEDTDSATAAQGGVAGMAGASPDGGTNAAATPVNSSRTRKKVTNNSYEINKTTSNILQAAGGIKHLTAAVFVAQRYDGTGANRKPVPRTDADIQNLTQIVQSALGVQGNEVTLKEMPFNDQFSTEITQSLDKQEKRQYWTELGMKMIYPALALGVVFLFWRTLKGVKADEMPVGVPAGGGPGQLGRSGVPANLVTVDVLNQLIRENPGNMSQAVRTWMVRNQKPNS